MKLNDYQDATAKTAVYPGLGNTRPDPDAVQYLALGLAGEAGEVAEKVKKWRREDDVEYINDLLFEMGDVLWYWARLCDEVYLDADHVAQRNLIKLNDRQERDALTGEGDDR